MMIAKLLVSVVVVLASASASASDWSYECQYPGDWHQAYVPCISAVEGETEGWKGDNNTHNSQGQDCRAYNRDGRTCGFVGFGEGQEGYPWGGQAGKFRCTNGCLQYLGQ